MDGEPATVLRRFENFIADVHSLCSKKGLEIKADAVLGRKAFTTPKSGPIYIVMQYDGLSSIGVIKPHEWWFQAFFVGNIGFEFKTKSDEERFVPEAMVLPFFGNYRDICGSRPAALPIGLRNIRKAFLDMVTNKGEVSPTSVGIIILYLCEGPKLVPVCDALKKSLVDPRVNTIESESKNGDELIHNYHSMSRSGMRHYHSIENGENPEPLRPIETIPGSGSITFIMKTVSIFHVNALRKEKGYHIRPVDPPSRWKRPNQIVKSLSDYYQKKRFSTALHWCQSRCRRADGPKEYWTVACGSDDGWLEGQRQQVDLESLTFHQASNQSCESPCGTSRTPHKGQRQQLESLPFHQASNQSCESPCGTSRTPHKGERQKLDLESLPFDQTSNRSCESPSGTFRTPHRLSFHQGYRSRPCAHWSVERIEHVWRRLREILTRRGFNPAQSTPICFKPLPTGVLRKRLQKVHWSTKELVRNNQSPCCYSMLRDSCTKAPVPFRWRSSLFSLIENREGPLWQRSGLKHCVRDMNPRMIPTQRVAQFARMTLSFFTRGRSG